MKRPVPSSYRPKRCDRKIVTDLRGRGFGDGQHADELGVVQEVALLQQQYQNVSIWGKECGRI